MAPATRPVANLAEWRLWNEGGLLTLELARRKNKRETVSKFYRLTPLHSAWGQAFRLSACEGTLLACGAGEGYDVLLDGHSSSCTCAGFTYTKGCGHVQALLSAQAEGLLDPAA